MSKQKLVVENQQRALYNKKLVNEMVDEFNRYIDRYSAPEEYQNACFKAKKDFTFKMCLLNTNYLIAEFGDASDGAWLVNAPILISVSQSHWL